MCLQIKTLDHQKEYIKQVINTILILKKKKSIKLRPATVTIEIHSNIVNTLNNMGSEMVEFAKKHYEEQQQITSEITEILKEAITTIADENKKLKEDLHIVYQQFKN